jgi:invasion protein IalB
MKIILADAEMETLIHTALCNGLSTMGGFGLELNYNKDRYQMAKNTLKNKTPNASVCFEDVLVEMFKRGNELTFKDVEGDEPDAVLNISLAKKNLSNADAVRDIVTILDENDGGDAWTASNILQYALYGKIIYG